MSRVPSGETVVDSSDSVSDNETVMKLTAKGQSGFV